MSFADFLTDRVNIYHMRTIELDGIYGLPNQRDYEWPDNPDETDVPCHFCIGGAMGTVVQSTPGYLYQVRMKAQFQAGTDIRPMDRIVDTATGYEYRAEVPRAAGRGHHIACYLVREDAQEAL